MSLSPKTMAVLLAVLAIVTEVPAIEIESHVQEATNEAVARHGDTLCTIRPTQVQVRRPLECRLIFPDECLQGRRLVPLQPREDLFVRCVG